MKIWDKLHTFFNQCQNNEEAIELYNDDLVGFFNSLPQERIFQALQLMLDRYEQLHGTNQQPTFSVHMTSTQKAFRVFRGRSTCRQIKLQHLIEFVRIAFDASFFTCLGHVFKQNRGATIGNQLSPALCAMTVAAEEQLWWESWELFLNSQRHLFFLVRYVDNRLSLIHSSIHSATPFQQYTDLLFYKPPVELEPVGDNHFLGFNICPFSRQARYILPTQQWQLRNPHGAGTTSTLYSGFRSRVVSIVRFTWPQQYIWTDVMRLISFYTSFGYQHETLCELATTIYYKQIRQRLFQQQPAAARQ